MIQLYRGPEPAFLSNEKVVAAKEKLVKSFNDKNRQERFRFDISLLRDVRPDLMKVSHGKCAYCESLLGVASQGDVENFRPKAGARGLNTSEYASAHYWWLAYEWNNLLMSCQICNQKYKRDYFPLADERLRASIGAKGDDLLLEQALLIDPCSENPAEHLQFTAKGIVADLSPKGKVTIEILGLNRTELVDRRKNVATDLLERLQTLQTSTEIGNSFTRSLVSSINNLYESPGAEYVAIQRAIFESWQQESADVWEDVKTFYSDQTPIAIPTKTPNATGSLKETNELSQQLSAIKRFSIKTVYIENFKSIEKIELQISPVNEQGNKESWLLLLGDNGIGKSSILQAIALALVGKKQLKKLKLDVSDFLRRGTDSGKVVIQSYESDASITLNFNSGGFFTDLDEAPTFILGYGSTRLLPKGPIKPDLRKEPYVNIRNLFDYSVSLIDPEKWLSSIPETEFNERVAPVFFDILSLRENDKVYLKNGKILITQYGDDHELEDNSDGYKTVVAMVADIMQTISIDQANYHNSQGIVLIDEIGNHLHPRWRMKIVAAIRRAFPKLQFIVSTHEPLCLRGLSYGEVVVLVRDQKNSIRALDRQLLPDHSVMRIEQLLTSDLFGLISLMDDEAEKTYEEYYRLLSKKDADKTPEDKEMIKTLSVKLSGPELLGNTPQEQVYYQIIDETYVQKFKEEGFKTVEELKQETISEVKNIIIKNKPSWL